MGETLGRYDPRFDFSSVLKRLGLTPDGDAYVDAQGRRVVQVPNADRPGCGVFQVVDEPVDLSKLKSLLESFWVGRKGRQVHPAVEAALRDRFEAGERDEEIAEGLGCGTSLVRELRYVAGLRRGPRHARPVPEARLRELHASGAPPREIAEALGLALSTVYTRCAALGLRANKPRQMRQFTPLHLTSDELDEAKERARAAGYTQLEPWIRSLMGFDR